MIKRKFYEINEDAAKTAHEMNRFGDYESNSATVGYRAMVEKVYQTVDKIEEKRPAMLEKAEYMACRYSKKLAMYFNSYYNNECRCPSIAISGGGNFPVKKKKKQNERRDVLAREYNELKEYEEKIKNLLYAKQVIRADDTNAIELLEEKVTERKERQEFMKAANKAVRKKDIEAGNEELRDLGFTEKQISAFRIPEYGVLGFQPYELSGNNAEIHRLEKRIETLRAIKETGSREYETEFFSVTEDAENMRLRLFFDYKPSEEIRDTLKSNGFKWSPSNECWQRQLTESAKFAMQRVLEKCKNEVA